MTVVQRSFFISVLRSVASRKPNNLIAWKTPLTGDLTTTRCCNIADRVFIEIHARRVEAARLIYRKPKWHNLPSIHRILYCFEWKSLESCKVTTSQSLAWLFTTNKTSFSELTDYSISFTIYRHALCLLIHDWLHVPRSRDCFSLNDQRHLETWRELKTWWDVYSFHFSIWPFIAANEWRS